MKTEQQKSDIKYKNMNPKLSMKSAKTGYKPAGAGANKTETKKPDSGQRKEKPRLSMSIGADGLPLKGLSQGNLEKKVSTQNAKQPKRLSLTQNAGANLDAGQTKPTWNTRKGRKARRYK